MAIDFAQYDIPGFTYRSSARGFETKGARRVFKPIAINNPSLEFRDMFAKRGNATKISNSSRLVDEATAAHNLHLAENRYGRVVRNTPFKTNNIVTSPQQVLVDGLRDRYANIDQNNNPSSTLSASKYRAWRDTPRYNGVTSATAKPFKTISMQNVPASNVPASNIAASTTVGNVAKQSMLNRLINASKSGAAKKLGIAAVTSAATNILPGSDDTIPIPWLESTVKGLETAGEWTGGLSLASLGASLIPGVQPVTLPLSSISGIASASSSGLANILRSAYGEKPVKQVVGDIGEVDTNPAVSLHGEDDPAELGHIVTGKQIGRAHV